MLSVGLLHGTSLAAMIKFELIPLPSCRLSLATGPVLEGHRLKLRDAALVCFTQQPNVG